MPERSGRLTTSVRDHHLSLILQQLLQTPQARKQLGESTRIGSGTITRLVNKLIAGGYLEDGPPIVRPHTSGRPQVPLQLRCDDGKVLIGIQIHADAITVDAFTLTGDRIDSTEQRHRNTSRRAVLGQAIELTRDMINTVGPDHTLGVGVSTSGHVDVGTGELISSPVLGWRRTDLRGTIGRDIDAPIVVDNTVRALAAERLHWSPWAAPNMLVVVVSGVINSAMIIDRRLYRGSGAAAGDIAHFPVALPGSGSCSCGQRACASTTLTDGALVAAAQQAKLIPAGSSWDVRSDTGPSELLELRRSRARHLGITVGHLIAINDPDSVIIAGAIGSRDDVREAVRQARTTAQRHRRRQTAIHSWDVTHHDRSAGAAALLFDDFLHRPTAYDPSLL